MSNLSNRRWSAEKSQAWYENQPWLCGFNYLPSTAVNSTEMWARETFDPDTLRRELGWVREIGFNCCRVFVQYLVWQADPLGMQERLNQFLGIAQEAGIKTLVILFDDCAFAGKKPYLGPQEEPAPGIHSSGWTPSPGPEIVDNPALWAGVSEYVRSVISNFAQDKRVLGWDIYNEPGNEGRGVRSLPLLQEAFGWARAANPSQPLLSGVWAWDEARQEINDFLLDEADVLTFHEYADAAQLQETIKRLKETGRPVLCTEWMSRTLGSKFETHLPVFKRENVGCFFWGLVNGRTQTHFPWGSTADAPPPKVWFHDLLDIHGKSYRSDEVNLIRQTIVP
jgi:hypothetical protein